MNENLLNKIAATAYSYRDTVINSYELAKQVINKGVYGVFVECGVAAGAQIAAMQAALNDLKAEKPIYAFDSFEGIPMAGPEDTQQPGIGIPTHDVNAPLRDRLVSSNVTVHGVENVIKNFTSFGFQTANVKFVKGWFQETLPLMAHEIDSISILRLDGDLYESTMVCLEYLFPKVSKGGIVIIDDYALPGARKAFSEYIWKNKIEARLIKVPPEQNGVVWFEKMTDAINATPSGIKNESADAAVVKNYSQNNEQEIIRNYFNGRNPSDLTVLDIGANDGETFSNSRQLILDGWSGILLEPSPRAFERLSNLYRGNDKVKCFQLGIGPNTEEVEFWESGAFNHTGPDVALVSCVDPKEKNRWGNAVSFIPIKINLKTFSDFVSDNRINPPFNFINIDAEGMDYEILKQINLDEICECFCIEHNSVPDMVTKYRGIADYFGYREIGYNAENLIFAR
jgi:O-methyltransferase